MIEKLSFNIAKQIIRDFCQYFRQAQKDNQSNLLCRDYPDQRLVEIVP
jgi:hypothetical protein